jgi:hypothetical protein
LIAPQQNVSYTYEELDLKARCLASGLEDIGYKPGSVALSDVPNVAENILLQLALSHVGAAIMTPPKDAAALDALLQKYDVCGIICVDATAAWLEHTEAIAHHRMPIVSLEAGDTGPRPASATVDFRELLLHCPPRGGSPVAVAGSLLGVYGGSALTHGEAITLGRRACDDAVGAAKLPPLFIDLAAPAAGGGARRGVGCADTVWLRGRGGRGWRA